jgi:hypothetical protein
MAGRKRTVVKFYIRAREPMDAEISDALDEFARNYHCDRSGAARHLILLGQRYLRERDLGSIAGQLRPPKTPLSELGGALSRGQWERRPDIQSGSDANTAIGTPVRGQSPPSQPVTQMSREAQSPCQSAQPAERTADIQSAEPAQVRSRDETLPKRLDMSKLRYRS